MALYLPTVLLMLLSLFIFSPLAMLVGLAFLSSSWGQLFALPSYLFNTFVLVLGGSGLCLVWGVSTAWFSVNCSFPFHKSLRWLLILPLACPAYLAGFIYAEMLESLMNIRTIIIAALLFGSALFPYIYIFSRAAFMQQSLNYQLAAHSLGLNKKKVFLHITLPMALPFISFGWLLTIIEIINDFGLVSYYAINTLSLGIYRTWLGRGDFTAAVQLSLLMLFIIIIIMFMENRLLAKQRRFENLSRYGKLRVRRIEGWRGWIICLWCLFPCMLGFIVPVIFLSIRFMQHAQWQELSSLIVPLGNTLFLAGITISLCITAALVLNYTSRMAVPQLRFLGQAVNLCYALPGTLLGLAIIALLSNINNMIDSYILSGGFFALLYGYVVRFHPPANRIIHNSMEKITPSVEMAARGFGLKRIAVLRTIHLPLLKGSLWSSVIILFTELLKELPLTLMLRPFNFDTLAISVYQYASDERLNTAAGFALLLIFAGLPALYLLNHLVNKTRTEQPL